MHGRGKVSTTSQGTCVFVGQALSPAKLALIAPIEIAAPVVVLLSHSERVTLRRWRHDPIHAQIERQLAIVIGEVPNSKHSHAELGVGSSIGTADLCHWICIDAAQHAIPVGERLLQVRNKFGLCTSLGRASLFAMAWRSLAFDLVEERNVRACRMLELLSE